MRTRLIKMKVLASKLVLLVVFIFFCECEFWLEGPTYCGLKLPFFCSFFVA